MSEKIGAMVRVESMPLRQGHEQCYKVRLDCDSVTGDGLELCHHEAIALLDQLAEALQMEPVRVEAE